MDFSPKTPLIVLIGHFLRSEADFQKEKTHMTTELGPIKPDNRMRLINRVKSDEV